MQKRSLWLVSIMLFLVVTLITVPMLTACSSPTSTSTPTTTAPTSTQTSNPTSAPSTTATTAPVSGRVIDLSLATQITNNRTRYKVLFEPWIKKVEELSQGKVKITTFPAESLVKVADSYDAIVTGIAKIAETNHSYTSQRFPLVEVVNLPGLGISSVKAGTYIMRDLYEKFPEFRAEYKDMHLLWNSRLPSYTIQTNNKPVRTLEDIKGLRLRTSGGVSSDAIAALGAAPLFITMGDTYLALQKGTVDGYVSDLTTLFSRKFYEIQKYSSNIDFGSSTMYVGMNLETWNSLPPDIQKAFDEACKLAIDLTSNAWEAEMKEAYDNKPAGFEFITITPENVAKINAVTATLVEKWVNDNKAKAPAQAILAEVIRLAKQYKDVK